MASYSVANKTALVTGAARGIGFATAELLHQRGASVTLVDLDDESTRGAAERIGSRTLAIGADVADRDAMDRAVEETVERFGGLDIVVANAGVAPPVASSRTVDRDVFERTVEIDLLGVWRTVRPALDHVVARQGQVVVVSSVYAWVNGALGASYAVSKAGVEQLARALRVELAPHGASACVAHFGFIDTPLVRNAFADPIGQALEDRTPGWMSKRLKAEDAGAAIVRGLERRAPRVIAPSWWRVWYALRGVINPVADRWMLRDEQMLDLIRRGDVEERGELRGGLEKTEGKTAV